MTDLHFSGATSKDNLIRIILRSFRAELMLSMEILRDLLEEKITRSSA